MCSEIFEVSGWLQTWKLGSETPEQILSSEQPVYETFSRKLGPQACLNINIFVYMYTL